MEDRSMFSAGSLDTTFANAGTLSLTPQMSGNATQAQNVATEADGDIIVGGVNFNVGGQIMLSQYNADGSVDSSYGTSGTATINLLPQGTNTTIADVLPAPDGSVIVIGTAVGPFGPQVRAPDGTVSNDIGTVGFIADISANGELNTAFGNGAGMVTLSSLSGQFGLFDGFMQPSGKIDLVVPSSGTFGVTQYNADGSLDTSFGNNGVANAEAQIQGTVVANVEEASATLTSSGQIIVAGWKTFTPAESSDNQIDIAMARFNSDGSLDTTFGTNGIVAEQLSGQNAQLERVVADPDGTITTEGFLTSNGQSFLARFNADGTLDQNFGTAGVTMLDSGLLYNPPPSIAVQSDGKVLVSSVALSSTGMSANTPISLVRYNTDGTVDSSFSAATSATAERIAVSVEPDGNILLDEQTTFGTGDTVQQFLGDDPTTTSQAPTQAATQSPALTSSLANPFSVSGSTLTVTGTTGADSFEVMFTDATDFVVALNGVSESFSTSQITTVNFNGNGGADTSVIGGSMGTEQTQLSPGSGQISGVDWTITLSNSPTIWVYGNSASTSQLFGSTTTTNTFVGGVPFSYMYGSGYSNYVVNFGSAYGYAQSTQDVAFFYSAHDATMAMSPDYSYLNGGIEAFADNFATVQAYGAGDGSDQSFLYGGKNGGDDFSTTVDYSFMSGNSSDGNYFNVANGFAAALGVAEGTDDFAYFTDNDGGSRFAATSGTAGIARGNSTAIVEGFQAIYSTATVGTDAANVLVSDADPLSTQGNTSTLNGSNGTLQMTGFQVTPVTEESIAAAGSSNSNSAIDFVMSGLATDLTFA